MPTRSSQQLRAGRLVRRLCAPIFGSLDRGGRRRPRLGPPRAAARRARRRRSGRCGPGQVSHPIAVPGRLFDRRRPGHPQDPDRRSAQRRSQPEAGVDQLPAGHDPAAGRADRRALCRSGAEHRRLRRRGRSSRPNSTAKSFRATRSELRDLPPALQEMMLPMQVGQATRPFGSHRGRRPRRWCFAAATKPIRRAPTFDQVYERRSTEERVNMRARRYLRDLRRDAVIEFR